MLPSLGFQEILILGVLALVVVGPKDLPLLFRKIGRWTAKLRGMAQEFRTGFDELARQAELDELKKEVDALRRNTVISDINREISKPLPTLETYAGLSHDVKHGALAPSPTPQVAGPEIVPNAPQPTTEATPAPAPADAPAVAANAPQPPADDIAEDMRADEPAVRSAP